MGRLAFCTRGIAGILLTMATIFTVLPAYAEDMFGDGRRKHALVIGIERYRYAERLLNPVADAKLLASRLSGMGFVVEASHDAALGDLRAAIERFLAAANGADVAVVYYSGHGLQIDGENYLVPADFNDHAGNAYGQLQSVNAILARLADTVKARVILLDACRNSPFLANIASAIGRSALPKGLAPIDQIVSDTGRFKPQDGVYGMIVGYATQPSLTADDGPEGRNSPYAVALNTAMTQGDADMNAILVQTANQVISSTQNRQHPEHRNAVPAPLYLVSRSKPLECDLLAAEEDNRVAVPGVKDDLLDAAAAEKACRADLAQYPGNPRLMHNLGRALRKAGRFEEAIELHRRAAELGYEPSQNDLGWLLLFGRGTNADAKEAMVWFQRAAAHGYRQAIVSYTGTDLTPFLKGPTHAEQVTALQRALRRAGAPEVPLSGVVDKATLDGVDKVKRAAGFSGAGITFQLIHRLDIVGEVFPSSRS